MSKTINQMILSTLKTKHGTVPKYRDELKAAGYEVFEAEHSTQGFWGVRKVETGDSVIVSKDYGDTTALYWNDWKNIVTGYEKIKKVDFEGLFSVKPERVARGNDSGRDPYGSYPVKCWCPGCSRHEGYWYRVYNCWNDNMTAYRKFKAGARHSAERVEYKREEVEKAQRALEKAIRELEQAIEEKTDAHVELAMFLDGKGIRR